MTNAGILNSKIITIKNGMQVVVVENNIAPTVSVAMAYKVGTADDPSHIIGVSHFLEHMMFKGTKKVPGDKFIKTVLLHGGSANAFTSYDYTVYTTDIAKEFLEIILELEADRMTNLSFNKEEVESEKKVVQEERLMRIGNNPIGSAHEAILKNLFWYHNYGIHPIGYPHHIDAYNYENTFEHYKKWYAPNNAVLILSGRITIEEAEKLAEKYFGDIKKSKSIPIRKRVEEPHHGGVIAKIEQESDRLKSNIYMVEYAAPNHDQPSGKISSDNYLPLIIVSHYLAGNEKGVLYQRLVEEKELAIDAGSSFGEASIDPSTFGISATLSKGVSFDEISSEINIVVKNLIKNGISKEDIDRCVNEIESSYAFSRDGNSGTIYMLIPILCGIPLEDIDNFPSRLKSVTVEQINKSIKLLFNEKPIVEARLSPKK